MSQSDAEFRPDFPKPPFPPQTKSRPADAPPRPDHGEATWRGAGRLDGRLALIRAAGRRVKLLLGDIGSARHCREIAAETALQFGRVDILVNNAAHQRHFDAIEDIDDEEWRRTFDVNLYAIFYLVKACLPFMKAGGSIISTASNPADTPNPSLPT